MKFNIFLYLIFTVSAHSQINIYIGTIHTSLPDPVSQAQEKRATTEDKKTAVSMALMSAETQVVRKYVVDYENSLISISAALRFKQREVHLFLDKCIDYIVAKNSISGNIPGLSKLATKSRLIAYTETSKIRTLKTELDTLFKADNYMTEGERKVLLLDIVDRALELAL